MHQRKGKPYRKENVETQKEVSCRSKLCVAHTKRKANKSCDRADVSWTWNGKGEKQNVENKTHVCKNNRYVRVQHTDHTQLQHEPFNKTDGMGTEHKCHGLKNTRCAVQQGGELQIIAPMIPPNPVKSQKRNKKIEVKKSCETNVSK